MSPLKSWISMFARLTLSQFYVKYLTKYVTFKVFAWYQNTGLYGMYLIDTIFCVSNVFMCVESILCVSSTSDDQLCSWLERLTFYQCRLSFYQCDLFMRCNLYPMQCMLDVAEWFSSNEMGASVCQYFYVNMY